MVSLVGTSNFSDFNVVIAAAWPGCGNRTKPSAATIGRQHAAFSGPPQAATTWVVSMVLNM